MSIKVQMAPIWRSARPLIGESSPSAWPAGKGAGLSLSSCHCPARESPGPGPRVADESVPGAGGQKEAASPPSRRERRSPAAELQRQLGFPHTAQPVQNLHAYYVLARGQDLTEAGQFFLTPGEQRSGRPREVIHRCRDAYLVRTEDAACGQDDGTVLNRSVIPGYRDSEMTWALVGRSPDAGTVILAQTAASGHRLSALRSAASVLLMASRGAAAASSSCRYRTRSFTGSGSSGSSPLTPKVPPVKAL